MSLGERLAAVRSRLAAACVANARDSSAITLVAVSKQHPADRVREALALGQRAFGENRVQELVAKATALAHLQPSWHMIGSVQTNKVRDLLGVPGLALLHSLDRDGLADALQVRLATHPHRRLACLIEVNASGDATKHGVAPNDAGALLAHVLSDCPSLEVRGLMAMGPLASDPRPVFGGVVRLRDDLVQRIGRPLPVLSLGMSDDLEAAIAAGSTMVRVGTSIFGDRH